MHWTWDDLRPPKKSRSEFELGLIGLLILFPKSFNAISHLIPLLDFEKAIHSKVFQIIHRLSETEDSIFGSKLVDALNKEIDIGREWTVSDLFSLVRQHGWNLGNSQASTDEHVVELAQNLIKGQSQ
jgi:replicative DNA helicase